MSFSERAEYETPMNPFELMLVERSQYSSLAEYIRELVGDYTNLDGGKANMLQLERTARALTNPRNEQSYPSTLTDAFYWGEIIAYRMNDFVSDGAWGARAYGTINSSMKEIFAPKDGEASEHSIVRHERLADEKLSELEVRDMYELLHGSDELIVSLTEEMQHMPEERQYTMLGFRYIAQQQLDKDGYKGMCSDMLEANGMGYIQPLEG
jgi:hypothetical protein